MTLLDDMGYVQQSPNEARMHIQIPFIPATLYFGRGR